VVKLLTGILLVICILGLVVGLADVGSPMFSGLALAFGAVFFILFYITRALEIVAAAEEAGSKSAEPLSKGAPSGTFVPSPDAMLSDGDGAALQSLPGGAVSSVQIRAGSSKTA
jgi:hypothetical protein